MLRITQPNDCMSSSVSLDITITIPSHLGSSILVFAVCLARGLCLLCVPRVSAATGCHSACTGTVTLPIPDL